MSSVYVICWIFLQTFQTYFCIQANSVDPDQTALKGAVWSGSTLFEKITFKITSRWQSRRQQLWLALKGLRCPNIASKYGIPARGIVNLNQCQVSDTLSYFSQKGWHLATALCGRFHRGLTLSSLSFWSELFHLWIWSEIEVSVRHQNRKANSVDPDGAVSSGSTLLAKALVCRA